MDCSTSAACGQAVLESLLPTPFQTFVRVIMAKLFALFALSVTVTSVTSGMSIAQIQGPAFQSPYNGQTVHNVTGTVVAKASNGYWIAGESSGDIRESTGLYVYTTSAAALGLVSVGDAISLSGRVTEFKPNGSPNNLFLTELTNPSNVVVMSSNNSIKPVVLGKDRSPPTQHFSVLDAGADGFLGFPNNISRIETVNATLQPDKYGLDFWESLEGQLVTIRNPTATGFPNNYGDFWVYGDWRVTGQNKRGGLTINFGYDGIPDGNPETIAIGTPLDGTKRPAPALGVRLSDITGVVTYNFGFYYVLPLTAPTIVSVPTEVPPPTSLTSEKPWYAVRDLCMITFGDYNVENLNPKSSHLPTIAQHIVQHMKTPNIIFLQEIQDNTGATNDGTVSANLTLSTLSDAIRSISDVSYAWAVVDPIDGQDGGQPGGNIRTAFFYNPEVLNLVPGAPPGGALDEVKVNGFFAFPKLNFNPGRIQPSNPIWDATRKPLVAHWKTKWGAELFTVNVHLSSKGGSASAHGDARTPTNGRVDVREGQAASVATFVKAVLAKRPWANIIVGGDFNEFIQTRSVYKPLTSSFMGLTDIDEAAGIPEVERYSYTFDQNQQQLDHALISPAMKFRKVEFEHIHVNTWSPTLKERISDHDPAVGRVRLCL